MVVFTFWCPNGLFLGSGKGSKTILWSTNVVEQLSFSILPSILTFEFDIILGSFLTFWGPNGYFWGWGRGQKLFWGLLIYTNNFSLQSIALYLLYHVALSLWWVLVMLGEWWFPAITYSQPKYSFGCFVVGVVVFLGFAHVAE